MRSSEGIKPHISCPPKDEIQLLCEALAELVRDYCDLKESDHMVIDAAINEALDVHPEDWLHNNSMMIDKLRHIETSRS